MDPDFDWITATRLIAEYEKKGPKSTERWRYYNGYYCGAKYGRILPEPGWMHFTTQA